MKKLLIPTDFSDISKNSIVYGFQLAEILNLEVNLVHVLEIYKFAAGTSEAELISTILPADNIQEMEKSAMASFQKLFDELKSEHSFSAPYTTKVIPGHLVNEMVVQSGNDENKFMVLAVAGNQDLITRFTHNTISSIINDAVCPVIIVPSGFSFKLPTNVLFATDFNKADLDVLSKFIHVFGEFNPEIEVLHVTPKPIEFKTELKFAGFKQLIIDKKETATISFKLKSHKHVVQGILEAIKADNSDMLIILKEHENFFKSLFDTSKAEKIAHFLKIPMISYRQTDLKNKK
jgi:nucleotide-binding universal stress UspA family protein